MRTLQRRLGKLEDQGRRIASPVIRLFWSEELLSCSSHANCGIERATGEHHSRLIPLTFKDE